MDFDVEFLEKTVMQKWTLHCKCDHICIVERTHTMTYFLKFLFSKLSENGMTSEIGSFFAMAEGRWRTMISEKWK